MAEIIAAALVYLKSHITILVMGFLGAIFNALLSKETWRDRVVGSIAGIILVVVFAEHASNFFANGKFPELFGFVLGAAGKSTAELLLDTIRSKIKTKITGGDNVNSDQSNSNR